MTPEAAFELGLQVGRSETVNAWEAWERYLATLTPEEVKKQLEWAEEGL